MLLVTTVSDKRNSVYQLLTRRLVQPSMLDFLDEPPRSPERPELPRYPRHHRLLSSKLRERGNPVSRSLILLQLRLVLVSKQKQYRGCSRQILDHCCVSAQG
jgi:hypothetical protein